jgi:hypothetical protein
MYTDCKYIGKSKKKKVQFNIFVVVAVLRVYVSTARILGSCLSLQEELNSETQECCMKSCGTHMPIATQ